jgi:hypothetical protein
MDCLEACCKDSADVFLVRLLAAVVGGDVGGWPQDAIVLATDELIKAVGVLVTATLTCITQVEV